MGYRSNIKIYLVETETKLEEIIKESKEAECTGQFTIGFNSENKRVLLVEFEGLKWYSEYKLVSYWENILKTTDPNNFLFTRLGEDFKDVEIDGDFGFAYAYSDIGYDVDFKTK